MVIHEAFISCSEGNFQFSSVGHHWLSICECIWHLRERIQTNGPSNLVNVRKPIFQKTSPKSMLFFLKRNYKALPYHITLSIFFLMLWGATTFFYFFLRKDTPSERLKKKVCHGWGGQPLSADCTQTTSSRPVWKSPWLVVDWLSQVAL